jgi:hypothetical protein
VLAPKMPEATVGLLRDEAYTKRCRETLKAALVTLESDKRRILGTRPAFGMLGSKKAIQAYEDSLRSAQDSEIRYLQQLKELEPIEHWLQSTLQDQLHEYLNTTSPEYHGLSEACVLVERWQNYVGGLHEFALGFARDARQAAALLASRSGTSSLSLQESVANLRATSCHIHAQTVRIGLVTQELERLGEAGNVKATLPALPTFHHGTWVDRIMLLSPSDSARELKRQEEVAREFSSGGKNDLIFRAESTRSLFLRARLESLNKYWDNLRPRVLQQCAEPFDVNKVFADLTRRYLEADLRRRQEAETNTPFSLVQ